MLNVVGARELGKRSRPILRSTSHRILGEGSGTPVVPSRDLGLRPFASSLP